LIVIDTNVVSEMMRDKPDLRVAAWLDEQKSDELWLTSINAAELLFGIARLPNGVRKTQVESALVSTLKEDFSDRILSFDADAAVVFAKLAANREASGKVGSIADTQIAAICMLHGAALATRNVRHFEGIGLSLVNPWAAAETI
jgi:toxin FitB